MAGQFPFRLFDVRVSQRHELSPSIWRFTMTGDDLDQMRRHGPDQRIKVFFPTVNGSLTVPDGDDWYARYRAMPEHDRPPMRTFTLRAIRPSKREVDIDFAVHPDGGPAARWALQGSPGQTLRLLGSDMDIPADARASASGVEWNPPASAKRILLVGDETALPALAGILEDLAEAPTASELIVLIEVPKQADATPLKMPANTQLQWLPRNAGEDYGIRMVQATRNADLTAFTDNSPTATQTLDEVDIDQTILWEQSTAQAGSSYAWVAGEAGAVMAIRRYLVRELEMPKTSVAFMGYWRKGRALD